MGCVVSGNDKVQDLSIGMGDKSKIEVRESVVRQGF